MTFQEVYGLGINYFAFQVPNTTDNNPANTSAPPSGDNKNNNNPAASATNRAGSTDRSQNGEIDYRKVRSGEKILYLKSLTHLYFNSTWIP